MMKMLLPSGLAESDTSAMMRASPRGGLPDVLLSPHPAAAIASASTHALRAIPTLAKECLCMDSTRWTTEV